VSFAVWPRVLDPIGPVPARADLPTLPIEDTLERTVRGRRVGPCWSPWQAA